MLKARKDTKLITSLVFWAIAQAGFQASVSAAPIFETTTPKNDLQGVFAAQVQFAQSQVMPSHPKPGDRQPHLVGGRKALVMVRPVDGSAWLDTMTLEARNSSGALLGTMPLQPPSALPKAVHSIGSKFTPNPGTTTLVNTSQNLNRLTDTQGSYLRTLLSQHAQVTIKTADGVWVKDIYLPSDVAQGKMVVVQSNAGYNSTVHYRGVKAVIARDQTLVFKFINGVWREESEGDSTLQYASNTWSGTLPEEWMMPGLTLKILTRNGNGEIKDLKVGAPTELLLHTIDIGMLTSPRGQFDFAKDPQAHREYFQTAPISRMVVNQYAPLSLPEVMLPNGTLLKQYDPSQGGWHDGTMRQSIGKELISHGINNANYGIHATAGSGEDTQPYVAAQVTAHNSRGVYANGVAVHGGSGGNGIVTLDESLGNEFSHELGHNFDLGHYVDGFSGSVHRSAGAINSTWGWDANKNRFIPNFKTTRNYQNTCLDGQCQAPFEGYSFGLDAMAGGAPFSAFNRFTLYTPNSAAIIQNFFEGKAIFDITSPTGFRKWSAATQRMEPYVHSIQRGTVAAPGMNDLNPTALQNLFAQYDMVKVNMIDGRWTSQINMPPASSANKNRYLLIDHQASFKTTLMINDSQVQIEPGFKKAYVSDGLKWNEDSAFSLTVPRTPQSFGVPVTTLVGYYDPQGKLPSYLYPALYGAYGMTYQDDADRITTQSCLLQVQAATQTFSFQLPNVRIRSDVMNKFHVNVPSASQPSSFSVVCGGRVLAQKAIAPTPLGLTYTVNGRTSAHSSVRQVTAPIDSGVNTVPLLNNLLASYDVVHFAMWDGRWTPAIQFPAASAANRGRVISVSSDATYSSQLLINDQYVPVTRGFKKGYTSDGSRWIEGAWIPNPDFE